MENDQKLTDALTEIGRRCIERIREGIRLIEASDAAEQSTPIEYPPKNVGDLIRHIRSTNVTPSAACHEIPFHLDAEVSPEQVAKVLDALLNGPLDVQSLAARIPTGLIAWGEVVTLADSQDAGWQEPHSVRCEEPPSEDSKASAIKVALYARRYPPERWLDGWRCGIAYYYERANSSPA